MQGIKYITDVKQSILRRHISGYAVRVGMHTAAPWSRVRALKQCMCARHSLCQIFCIRLRNCCNVL